jgi:hypothetical protein
MMVSELNMTFRKLILFSALTVLLGVGLVYALSYAFTPQNSSQTLPTTQVVYDGFRLTLTLEKTEYTLGELINTTLTLTNISNQTASFGLSDDFFDLQVYNGTNSTIYSTINDSPYLYENFHLLVNETLNAGQSLSEDLSWNQTSYPAAWQQLPYPAARQSEGVPVLPGTYYIVGQSGTTPIYGANGTIETTPIQITIAAP